MSTLRDTAYDYHFCIFNLFLSDIIGVGCMGGVSGHAS